MIARPLTLREASSDDIDNCLALVQEGRGITAQTVENMVSTHSFSGLLETLPQDSLLSLEDSDAPVIRLVTAMLEEASAAGASDIHIETFQHFFQVRYRIDGVMQNVSQGDVRLAASLISRLKIMAQLDIAERRRPQDGRFIHAMATQDIDVRLSVIPVSHGERAVLRLLDPRNLSADYGSLGIPAYISQHLSQLIHKPNGIILVTGPTGSGKSSTLYATLLQLSQGHHTILTIEDPVEYKLAGVGQTQVNSRIALDFAQGLRALLRQDPDIVMIGEIRDTETARVAIQASLTGHLVFSTLHTNSAIGGVARLRDMGIESWLLASSLSALLAQRLVRKLCPHCRKAGLATKAEQRWLRLNDDQASRTVIYRPEGCNACGGRGYRGRTGIYELVVITPAMREQIQQHASGASLVECARQTLPGIEEDARQKVLAGLTSCEEVMRVVEESE
ncbi:GspE/PulE family protein [Enterobacter kobei]|uniref:GspE/PulE family protein n=1 Tax=Enterobacter kobei TaxID=208224 RepID=UPI003CE7844D